MRVAIAKVAQIDEAAKIRNASARLEAYARIHNDTEAQRKFAEIRLRAYQKIGELTRQLEKAKFTPRVGACVPNDGQTKEQQLKQAGISTSVANRAEQLPPSEKEAMVVAAAANWRKYKEHERNFIPTMGRSQKVSNLPKPESRPLLPTGRNTLRRARIKP